MRFQSDCFLFGLIAQLRPSRALAASLAIALLAAWVPAIAAPLWLDNGRPTDNATQAVATLASAEDDGLTPEDYDAAPLAQAVATAAQGPALDTAAVSRLDDALTAAVLRYLGDLHAGRMDPRRIYAGTALPPSPPFDAAGYLDAALSADRLADVLHAAAPALPLYAALRAELLRYRALNDHPAWSSPLPALPGPKLEPGSAWDGLPLLAQRLVAVGDLPPDAPVSPVYDYTLRRGVISFQQRHGLTADGVIGRATLAQLTVTPAERARQIGLAMERLRWTPLLDAPRMILVNLPEFVLRAYEVHDGKVAIGLTMNVIVGKALKTQTPLFQEEMRYIEFSPYWNVPPSIAREEILPRLRRDPAYFEQQGFEFVSVRASGEVDTWLTPENLDAVAHGKMRIRQRPGPQNALGDIKFGLRDSKIYLHHTPSTGLFQRERRDLSHGCIRLEDPVALARFVLQNAPAWSEERIRAAMTRGQSATLRLAEPLPVLIAYSTTVVKQGKVHFLSDIYGHDRLLEQALRQQSQLRAQQRPTRAPSRAQ